MSNLTHEPIKHNVYFERNVQSLGLDTENGKATLGVMKRGSYTFSASAPEKMVVVIGSMSVKLKDSEFKSYGPQEEFDVPAGTSFDVVCDADVAYVCYYG